MSPCPYPVKGFTAFTDCPGCGHLAFHWLSEPPGEDEEFPGEAGETSAVVSDREIKCWGGNIYRVIQDLVYRVDKTTCDHVRECVACGQEWGEK